MSDVQPDLFLVPDGDARRLAALREKYPPPGVVIQPGQFGTWEALAPELIGEGVIVRQTLRELLDKMDELLGGDPEDDPG